MPMQRTERKDFADLQERIPQGVGLEVNASQNVQARQRDPSKLLEALDGFTRLAVSKSEEKRVVENELLVEQGRMAGVTNQIDPELYEQQEAYRKGVDDFRTKTLAVEWFNDAREEYATASQRPDFNYVEWKATKLQQFSEGKDSLEELKAANGFMTRFVESFDAQFAGDEARRKVQDATKQVYARAAELDRGNLLKKPEEIAALLEEGRGLGLDDDEALSAIAAPIIASVRNGQVEKADLIREMVQDHPELGPKLADAMEFGTEARRREERSQNLDLFMDIENRVFNLTLTEDYVQKLVDDKVYTAEQGANLLFRQKSLREQRLNADRKANEKLGDELYLRQRIALGDLLVLPADQQRAAKKILDDDFSAYTRAFRDATRAGDPAAAGQAAQSAVQWLNMHRQNGVFPDVLKNQLEAVNFNDSAASKPTLEFARELMRNGAEDYLQLHIGGGAYRRLKEYASMVENTGNVDAAIDSLAARTRMTPEQINTGKSAFTRELNEARRNIGDLTRQLAFDEAVNDYYGNLGLPMEAAIQKAQEEVEAGFTMVDGRPVKKETFLNELEQNYNVDEVFQQFKDEKLRPRLVEMGAIDAGDDSLIDIIPAGPKHPGKFYVRSDTQFIRGRLDEKGNVVPHDQPLIVDSYQLRVFAWDREDAEARKDNQREQQRLQTVSPYSQLQ